jgi:hypothetical protein
MWVDIWKIQIADLDIILDITNSDIWDDILVIKSQGYEFRTCNNSDITNYEIGIRYQFLT